MTDLMTHFPLITKSYVCMHAKTHQPSKWDNFWKTISLLFIQSSTQIPPPYSAGGPLHTISTTPWQTTLFHVSLKRQGLCSYDIITHPTHSQARIPSLLTHSDPHSVCNLAIFKFSKTLAEFVNFLIWRGRTEQEYSASFLKSYLTTTCLSWRPLRNSLHLVPGYYFHLLFLSLCPSSSLTIVHF